MIQEEIEGACVLMLNKPFLEPPNDVKKHSHWRNSVQVAEKGQNKSWKVFSFENICGHAFLYVLEFGDKNTLKPQVVTLNSEGQATRKPEVKP